MGKTLNTGIISAAIVKSFASIPAQADISVVNGSTLDCSNIKITAVKSVLGESSDSLYTLCNSARVNMWSKFKPGYVGYVNPLPTSPDANPTFEHVRNVYRLGDFAGYNHNENMKPTNWESAPSSNMGSVEYGASYPVNVSLIKGKLSPILDVGSVSDVYWSRIKIQVWIKTTGAYSLMATTSYIDFNSMPVQAMVMGGSQSIDNYTCCLRPVYCDDAGNPVAVIEDGIRVFTYSVASGVGSWSMADTGTYTDLAVYLTDVYFNFNITLTGGQAKTIDIKLVCTGDSMTTTIYTGIATTYFAPNSTNSFSGVFKLSAPLIDNGYFAMEVQISLNGGTTWMGIGSIIDLEHDNQ